MTCIVGCIFCKDSENSWKTSISYPFFIFFSLYLYVLLSFHWQRYETNKKNGRNAGDHFFHFIKKESVWTPLCYYILFIFLEHCNFSIEKGYYLFELRMGSLNDKCNITLIYAIS